MIGARRRPRTGFPAAAAVLPFLVLAACGGEEGSGADAPGEPAPRFTYVGSVLEEPPSPDAARARESVRETDEDWRIARGTAEWAVEQDLGLLPLGEVASIVGSTFVGHPYEPGTLELPGPEGLVVNLTAFDCVTFVEHVLVLSRLVVEGGAALVADEEAFRERYRRALTELRYRGGVLDGYPSRLHYFSEWIRDAESKGWVRDVTRELGGVRDERPIHFMSSNPEAYRQLGEDPAHLEAVRRTEERISAEPRYYVPQERIAEVAPEIRSGDVIAAVSTVDGLDVAHTGIAFRHAGRLHLLHAPLVDGNVEISPRPLAERILGISGQTGIMVARPLDPREAASDQGVDRDGS